MRSRSASRSRWLLEIRFVASCVPTDSLRSHVLDRSLTLALHSQLAIAKETGRRLGLGDHMYPAKVLKDGPAPGGKHASLDEMIMDADGFAGVFPEHKYEIVKRLQGLGHLCAMTGGFLQFCC
jgi:hypothetical protein